MTVALTDPRIRELLKRRGVDVDKLDAPAAAPDEPEGLEDRDGIEARRAKLHAAKLAKPARGLAHDHNLEPAEMDAVLEAVPCARTAVRLRRNGPAPPRCVACGLKVNAFSGECPHCRSQQPGSADLTPVRRRSVTPTPPRAEAPPMPATEPAQANGTHAPVNRVAAVAAAVKTCPTCHEPANPNGRCYKCRPGGRAFRPKTAPAAAKPRREPRPQASPPLPAAAHRLLDAIETLAGLDAATFARCVELVTTLREGRPR